MSEYVQEKAWHNRGRGGGGMGERGRGGGRAISAQGQRWLTLAGAVQKFY